MLTIKKLDTEEFETAKNLFLFFQEDDGVKSPVVPTDKRITELLGKSDFHVIVALDDGNLAGGLTAYEMQMYKKDIKEMFLYEIAVHPNHRKKNVATALVEFLKEMCRQKGIDEMFVGTETTNIAAVKLYESTGGVLQKDSVFFFYEV